MIIPAISLMAGLLSAALPDYTREAEHRDSLKSATVVADRGLVVSRTDTILTTHAVSVTDAFSCVPGLYIEDYGGPAGPKIASLRGMGSPHSTIYLDGVRISNAQSGQADLGMLDFVNYAFMVIDYAQNSISLSTAKPVLNDRSVGGALRLRGGSFGTYEPSGRIDFRLSGRICMSASAGAVLSRGDFPYGEENLRRTNNDIRQMRVGLDAWGKMDGGEWHAKAFYNGAERGMPGSVAWLSNDRQRDRNAFAQGLVHKQFSSLYTLSASAKLSYDDLQYHSDLGNSSFGRREVQVNTSHRFSPCSWFDFSLTADWQWNDLRSSEYEAARTGIVSAATATFHPGRLKADLALEYEGLSDRSAGQRGILSPSMDLRWNVSGGLDVVAFARRAYRVPTFNELYYPGYGNPDLRAEDAYLTDVGLEYHRSMSARWKVHVKADGFFNSLRDKIVSAPSEADPNIWLPYNVGMVRMVGTDLGAGADYAGGGLKASFSARYSYQDAIDRTPESPEYGEQIPFISKHTVCLGARVSIRGWSIAASWNHRGGRYDANGKMPDYRTLDLTAGKELALPHGLTISLKAMARNLTDCRYELASLYPMPGRSFYGEIDLKF